MPILNSYHLTFQDLIQGALFFILLFLLFLIAALGNDNNGPHTRV
jgi:hypothetical protein